jgi:hypothetical protein
MADIPMRIYQDTLHLAQFDIDVPILRVESMGDYFPIKAFCLALHITHQSQLEKINNDLDHYAAGTEYFPMDTAGGEQEVLCLRKRETAWWISTLSPKTLEKRYGATVEDLKQSLMDAADALWWGVRAVAPVTSTLVPLEHNLWAGQRCQYCGKHTTAPIEQVKWFTGLYK